MESTAETFVDLLIICHIVEQQMQGYTKSTLLKNSVFLLSFYSTYQVFDKISRVRRHNPLRLPRQRILRPPQRRNRLRLRIKVNPGLPIESVRATTRNTLLVPREAEHRQRDWDGDIDADLAGLDVLLEASGGGPRAGEDRGAVAVFVGVYEADGVVEGGHVEADEDGAEDLFGVAFHVGLYVCDEGWTDLRWGMRRLIIT